MFHQLSAELGLTNTFTFTGGDIAAFPLPDEPVTPHDRTGTGTCERAVPAGYPSHDAHALSAASGPRSTTDRRLDLRPPARQPGVDVKLPLPAVEKEPNRRFTEHIQGPETRPTKSGTFWRNFQVAPQTSQYMPGTCTGLRQFKLQLYGWRRVRYGCGSNAKAEQGRRSHFRPGASGAEAVICLRNQAQL